MLNEKLKQKIKGPNKLNKIWQNFKISKSNVIKNQFEKNSKKNKDLCPYNLEKELDHSNNTDNFHEIIVPFIDQIQIDMATESIATQRMSHKSLHSVNMDHGYYAINYAFVNIFFKIWCRLVKFDPIIIK